MQEVTKIRIALENLKDAVLVATILHDLIDQADIYKSQIALVAVHY